MLVLVDLPINKALRRGGNVVNRKGGKFWVTFKYERVPNFCFLCGKLGYDKRHCSKSPDNHNQGRQYGDWLRANGNLKNGFRKSKASNSRGYEDRDGRPDDRSYPVTSNSRDPALETAKNQ